MNLCPTPLTRPSGTLSPRRTRGEGGVRGGRVMRQRSNFAILRNSLLKGSLPTAPPTYVGGGPHLSKSPSPPIQVGVPHLPKHPSPPHDLRARSSEPRLPSSPLRVPSCPSAPPHLMTSERAALNSDFRVRSSAFRVEQAPLPTSSPAFSSPGKAKGALNAPLTED